MKRFFYVFLAALFLACSQKMEMSEPDSEIQSLSYVPQGDSSTYGLACDGCTDSTLIFLSDKGGDPVKYNIINARRNQLYFGHPEVGDRMAVLINPTDSTEVIAAIDMDQLCGTWVFYVIPEMRKLHPSTDIEKIKASLSIREKQRFDSLLSKLMVPREYGYTFKRDHTVTSVGGPPRKTALDDDAPVVYPTLRRYTEWHVFNGKLIFTYGGFKTKTPDSLQNMQLHNDTAELILLRRDTMVMRFSDKLQGYRLKRDSTKNEK